MPAMAAARCPSHTHQRCLVSGKDALGAPGSRSIRQNASDASGTIDYADMWLPTTLPFITHCRLRLENAIRRDSSRVNRCGIIR